MPAGCEDVELVGGFVGFALFGQRPAGFGGEMAMMKVFDGLFEADGDEEANDDGGDVDEEVAPGGGSGLVSYMSGLRGVYRG